MLAIVLRRAMALTAAGIAVGVVLAIAALRMAGGLLVGVSPADPTALAGSALFLGAVAIAAGYMPARRATRVDPAITLRDA